MDKKVNETKRVTVVPPKITPSSSRIKLRRDNERIIKRLEELEGWPFRIKKYFKCN